LKEEEKNKRIPRIKGHGNYVYGIMLSRVTIMFANHNVDSYLCQLFHTLEAT